MTNSENSKLDRRAFLRGLGVTAAAAPAAALALGAKPAEAAPADKQTTGYQETDHVRRAYDAARF